MNAKLSLVVNCRVIDKTSWFKAVLPTVQQLNSYCMTMTHFVLLEWKLMPVA
jgi:hypothetical protein